MDDGDDEENMLSPEEEMLVEAREFGKLDRLDPEAKRTRLRELNSPSRHVKKCKLLLTVSSRVPARAYSRWPYLCTTKYKD